MARLVTCLLMPLPLPMFGCSSRTAAGGDVFGSDIDAESRRHYRGPMWQQSKPEDHPKTSLGKFGVC